MLFVAACCGLASGADWLTVRGDQQHTNSQPDETELSARSVKRLHLLWKQQIKAGGDAVSDPILLGPIITNRGVKELVFVRAANSVYALDADLGTIFWTRVLESRPLDRQPAEFKCASGAISPLMNWSSKEVVPRSTGEDHFSNGNRPMYVLTSDGEVHVLRPSTGGDLLQPFPLVPANVAASGLGEKDSVLYATSSGECGGTSKGIWARSVGESGLEPGLLTQSTPKPGSRALASFEWNGQHWAVELAAGGAPTVRPESHEERLWPSSEGVATWLDATGTRWIYTAKGGSVAGFRVEKGGAGPTAAETWHLRDTGVVAGSPIVANGIVYFVSRFASPSNSHLILHALDARDGAELFQSGEQVPDESSVGHLALANGHICFAAASGTIYCFGLPFTM